MPISELIILAIILLIAGIMEIKTQNINPIVWCVGGVIALLYAIKGTGLILWQESLICLALLFIAAIVFLSSKFGGIFGGGTLKGICMCGMFFGRYTLIMIVVLFILAMLIRVLLKIIKNKFNLQKTKMPSMPIIMLAVAVTILVMEHFKILV